MPLLRKPDPTDPAWAADWPGVPDPQVVAGPGDTDGVPLRREKAEQNAGCLLVFLACFCVFWDSCVAGMVAQIGGKFLAGKGQWFEALFAVPFVAAGLFLTGLWFVMALTLVAEARVGPLLVELAAHPLRPGDRLVGLVAQRGSARLAGWSVALTCTERAVYNYATSSTTHTHAARRRPALAADDAPAGGPGDGTRFEAELPADAMHSFRSTNNHVEWAVEVGGRAWGWFPYSVRFPFVVLPADPTEPGGAA